MAAPAGLSAIGTDQFLQLLVAQLQNQDPLSPLDNNQLLSQLATLNTVSGIQQLNANFSEMLRLTQLTQGADLIGKTIRYTPAGGGDPVAGTVNSVQVQNGAFVLQVGDASVGLSQVVSVV
ncbi:MAG: flagellar hook capping protein [Gemmataceae bacterium]|nr:flagellar hook capping protein [Gemmataceae bacterium]